MFQQQKQSVTPAALLALIFVSGNVLAQNNDHDDYSDIEGLDEIVVTGTRIKGAAITSHAVTITREEIDARGFNDIEDVLASLPQNFSTLNSATTSLGTDNPTASIALATRLQGESLANLRGLGESNVLILVNGRRQATSSGAEIQSSGGISGVNVNAIPFSAIERVEIILDGASALYGADAIGGVINFILRRDYSGFEISARHESAENGGDSNRYSASFGHTWDTGNVTIDGSWTDTEPTSAAKAGFTTLNRVDIGGVDGRSIGSPGAIRGVGPLDFAPYGYLQADDDGTTPLTADDINGISGRLTQVPPRLVENIPIYLGADNEKLAFSLSYQQQLSGDSLEFYSDVQYAKDETESVSNRMPWIYGGFTPFGFPPDVVIPTSNAFNDTGIDLAVGSTLYQEALRGQIPLSENRTSDERFGVVAGLIYRPDDNWTIDFSGGINEVESSYENSMAELDFDALQLLANSSDPNVAFNPFGNGTAQNDLSSALVIGPSVDSLTTPTKSKTETWLLTAEGSLFSIPGGDVRVALGTEYRDESMTLHDDFLVTSGDRSQSLFATTRPSRSLWAGFVEANVPLVGEGNRKSGIYSLALNLAGRLDSYEGKASTPTTEIDNRFEEFSPKAGLVWNPVARLKIRGNWTQAFRAPTMTHMFQADRLLELYPPEWFYFRGPNADPFLPPGPNPPYGVGPAEIEIRRGPNNRLEGETSESWSVGFDWTPPFLESAFFSVNYNNTEISNQFQTTLAILFDDQIWVDGGFGPEGPMDSVRRNEAGYITALSSIPININGTNSESVDYRAGFSLDSSALGRLDFDWSATQTLKTERNILGTIDRRDGTDLGLPRWVHQASVVWYRDNYGMTFVANHTDSYDNIAGLSQILFMRPRDVYAQGLAEKVDSYTTFDLTGRYEFENLGLEVSAGVINLTDEDFPYHHNARGAPFDLQRVDPRGRRVFVNLRLSFDY